MNWKQKLGRIAAGAGVTLVLVLLILTILWVNAFGWAYPGCHGLCRL